MELHEQFQNEVKNRISCTPFMKSIFNLYEELKYMSTNDKTLHSIELEISGDLIFHHTDNRKGVIRKEKYMS